MSKDFSQISRRNLLRSSLSSLGIGGAGCSRSENENQTRENQSPANETQGGSGSQNATDSDSGPPDDSNMELVFEDTFDSDRIDAEKWRTNYPWDTREHNYNGYASSQNVYLYDGKLIIQAEEQSQEGNSYTTGVAAPKRVFGPGYVEGYIKTPPARPGFWPAFWLTSASVWPPEIDLFEFFGTDPRAWMSYHYENDRGEHQRVASPYGGQKFSDQFHRYSVDWNFDRIIWYIDGEERYRYAGENLKIEDMWLIFNFGIDPDFLETPSSEDLPATLEMAEVRVWELADD